MLRSILRKLRPLSNGTARPLSIAIIGAGFGGIGTAIQLKKAGIGSFTIFEKGDGVGGTWRENTYPGAACDVPSHLYSFSFEPKFDWSRRFASQPEILAYLEHCVRKHALYPHIRFQSEIQSASFDETRGKWRLETTTGQPHEADVLVSACGQLNRPAYPNIPGRDTFQGTQFHSAQWRHDYDLRNREIAVIGTGASAIQFVPQIIPNVKKLYLYQRTPPWVIRKLDRPYLSIEKKLFRLAPYRLQHRWGLYWGHEARFGAFETQDNWLGGAVQWAANRYLENQIADPALRARLTPDYPMGCKRVLISNEYLQSLSHPDVEVVSEKIDRITQEGIVSNGVTRQVDAIIYGTGFQSTDFLAPMRIVGRAGRELNEAWRQGAEAYLGVNVAGFPNLFILYGPNTNLAHNSIVFMLECQIHYFMQWLARLGQDEGRVFDLKSEVQLKFNSEVQRRLAQSVWNAGCNSWYINEAGKNTNNWPGPTLEYWWRTRRIDWANYTALPAIDSRALHGTIKP